MAKAKKKIKLPCGIVCGNCKTCVFRHYALTQGRCWNCQAMFNEKQLEEGEGI